MSDYLKKLENELNQVRSYGNEPLTLDNCDKEPIHLIGHIQNHGVFVACRFDQEIKRIDYISDNTLEAFKVDSEQLLGQPLDSLLSSHSIEIIEQAISMSLHNAHTSYDLELHLPKIQTVQASFHLYNEILFIEFQPFLSSDIATASFKSTGQDVIAEFTALTLKNYNFYDLSQNLVSFFFEALNYDRVMVYKFDDDDHGEVIAEAKNDNIEPFLGLHYPASDIPQFARYLYVQNRCRIISSITSKPIPIKSYNDPKGGFELDLRFSNLRSMSPIHIEYLSNMGIMASLTMSIVKENKLYAMLIMHNYKPRYCDLKSREIINQLSYVCTDYVKLLDRIEIATGAEKSQDIRNLINLYLFDSDSQINFDELSSAILNIFNGDGICGFLNGEHVFSKGVVLDDLEPFAEQVSQSRLLHSKIFYTSNLAKEWPEIYKLDKRICGLMLINIPSDKFSFIAIFRFEQAKLVRWAGRKQEYSAETDGRLHARKSFQEWKDYTKEQSQPWANNDLLNAKNIRSVFIRYLLRVNERNLAKLVSYDTLTGLPNRHFISNKIDHMLEEEKHVAMLFIDCDRFKTINDSLGHDIGDHVLTEVAARLKSYETKNSIAARLGGDEFTILIESHNLDEIDQLAATLIEAFNDPICFLHYTFHVPCSIGIALSTQESTRSSLMRSADMAMYEAKHNGGNCYMFVNDILMKKADERLEIEQDIYDALKKNQIVNYYQPIINSKTKKIYGFEALCRWVKSPTEIIGPVKFLGVAEETGLIIPIGIAIIDSALNDLKKIHAIDSNIVMTLNFSPLQMLDQNTSDYLISEVRTRGIDATKICIELTEESYIDDEKELIMKLNKLRQNSFRAALDDFGTGYSSLKYLTNLPMDVVKFDKTLIDQIFSSQKSYKLLEASKLMAEVCGLETVAEGIESFEQSQCVTSIGITYQQGYFFGKPTPIEEAIALLPLDPQLI